MASKTLMQETNEVTALDGDERFIVADDPSGTPVDGYVTASTIAGGAEWQGVTDSWAYASATTITVPSDATLKYQAGDKLRWRQGAGFLYGVIASVAATVITLIVTDDYAVANSAITDVAFSRVQNPFGFPDYFNYTPTLAGFSAAPAGNNLYRWRVSGKQIDIVIRQSANGTSDDTVYTMTPPVSAAVITAMIWAGPISFADNSGLSATYGRARIESASPTIITFSTNSQTGAWTNSGGKRVQTGSITYQFAL